MSAASVPGRLLLQPGHEAAGRAPNLLDHLPEGASWTVIPADALLMPPPVNAHDHGYGIRTLDFGNVDDALEVWIP